MEVGKRRFSGTEWVTGAPEIESATLDVLRYRFGDLDRQAKIKQTRSLFKIKLAGVLPVG